MLITIPAAILPALLLMWFFHRQDRFPEPPKVVWSTFGLGFAIVIPIVIVAVPVLILVQQTNEYPYVYGSMMAFFCAAIPEESFKFAIVFFYCMRHSEFDEPMDGLVYGVAASLGFATFENILYTYNGGLPVAIARAFTAVPMHAMLGAIMGYYAGLAKFTPESKGPLLFKAWAIPVVLHGLYDFPLIVMLAKAAPMEETTGSKNPVEMIGLVGCAIAVLVVGCVWAVAVARRMRAAQDRMT